MQKHFQKKEEKNFYRPFFALSILFIFLSYLYIVYSQYTLWHNSSPPARFLVPPYQGIEYVFGYHFTRFGAPYIVSLLVSLAFLFFFSLLNKKFSNKFFYPGEGFVGAAAIFLLGNPSWEYLWIYYGVGVFAVGILYQFVAEKIFKKDALLSFRWLWIPLAIVAILIRELLFAL